MSNCTAELDIKDSKWIKVNDHNLNPGGELINGNDQLYYIGGIDLKMGYKSKAVYEYQGINGWKKWNKELTIPKEMSNSWSVMRIGPEFCNRSKNVTRTLGGLKAWKFDEKLYFNYFEHN